MLCPTEDKCYGDQVSLPSIGHDMRNLLVFVALLLVPAFALAVPPGEMVFDGSKSAGQSEKAIKAGIEKAIDGMSFITRPIARGKLEKSNVAYKKITIDVTGKKVSIQHDSRKPIVSPTDGTQVKWVRDDGEAFMVSQKVSEDEIVQIFHSEDGDKTLTYKFADDYKKLTVHVLLESPKLAAPLKYALEYAR